MSTPISNLEGDFWLPSTPEKTIRGRLTAGPGIDANLDLDRGFFVDPQVSIVANGMSLSAAPRDIVEGFLPLVIHGRLDNGQAVTLVDARNHGSPWPFGKPRYEAHATVVGTHVDGESPSYSAVRFRIGHPYWLEHLDDGQTATVKDDGSILRLIADEAGNWLVYESASPATLRQLDARVVHSCVVLVQLALHQKVAVSEVQLQTDGGGAWFPVYGEAFGASTHKARLTTMLPREVFTVDLFARWIPLNDQLEGLSAAITDPRYGALEAHALVLSSLIEAVHRRLPAYQEHQTRFPDDADEALKLIEKAARRAAKSEAKKLGINPKDASRAVMFLRDVDFPSRAADIVTDVCAVVPEVVDAAIPGVAKSVDEIAGFLSSVRNERAHHLRRDPIRRPLEVLVLRWMIASDMSWWLLRCLLLLKAGIDGGQLRKHILDFQRFQLYRENLRRHAEELAGLTGAQAPKQETGDKGRRVPDVD